MCKKLHTSTEHESHGVQEPQPDHACIVPAWLLLVRCAQLQNKLSEARSTLTAAVDPATGKKLFHPETGRAPNFARGNAKAGGVGEYLYNLKQQQDDKARAVKEEVERKRVEDAQGNKQSASSKHMVKALQNKRFRQVRGDALLLLLQTETVTLPYGPEFVAYQRSHELQMFVTPLCKLGPNSSQQPLAAAVVLC